MNQPVNTPGAIALAKPWDTEPDRKEWVDPTTGYLCLIVRQTSICGFLCGYVGVPADNSLCGVHHRDIDANIHGGVTYSGESKKAICHLSGATVENSETTWWFGFHCGNIDDLAPMMVEEFPELAEFQTYRDFGYVEGQVTSLALQLQEFAKLVTSKTV